MERQNSSAETPPIAWSWICKPKRYGGLGIRDCLTWNTAAIGKYVWQLAKKEDTLWIKWVHHVYIKEENLVGVQAPLLTGHERTFVR